LNRLLPFAFGLVATACSTVPPAPPAAPAKEEIVAVTLSNRLVRFNAGQPQQVRDAGPLQGLRGGERIVGLDFRVARAELYALGLLGTQGQLYRVDARSATATPVGVGFALPAGGEWGFDFNPTVDRIRVVNDRGANLRLHPDTGAPVDADPNTPGLQADGALAWAAGDPRAGQPLAVVSAGYTYNTQDDKLTTNYALDGAAGWLVHQGAKEGASPAVSPNTGRVFGVGALGTGPFAHATFDISDLRNTAYAGLRGTGETATRWYRVDLASGRATPLGTVAGEALAGAAIEP
jgi:hypothetical protein